MAGALWLKVSKRVIMGKEQEPAVAGLMEDTRTSDSLPKLRIFLEEESLNDLKKVVGAYLGINQNSELQNSLSPAY